jgi:hypothetical protein
LDQLAADLRSCAARLQDSGFPESADVLREISAAVEHAAPRPGAELPGDLPF